MTANRPVAHCRLAFAPPCPTTSPRRSTTSTPRPISATRTPTIAADIMARHMRQRGEDVFFLTGTDEHGEPVAQAAERAGVSPRELADRNAQRFKDLVPRLEVSNDFFIRTSDLRARPARSRTSCRRSTTTATSTRACTRAGTAPAAPTSSPSAEIGPRQHLPDPRHPARVGARGELVLPPLHVPGAARAPVRRAPRLRAPRARYNEARAFIDRGLQDVSLSRAKLSWGVAGPVGRRARSSTSGSTRSSTTTRRSSYARAGRGPDRHASGRRPTTSSARTSSSSTRSTGRRCSWPPSIELPAAPLHPRLPARGRGEKMSKSLGNVSTRSRSSTRFGADALRYYCSARSPSARTARCPRPRSSPATSPSSPTSTATSPAARIAMVHRYRDGVVPRADARPDAGTDFDGLARRRERACSTSAELTAALETHLAARAPPQPLRRGAARPGSSPSDDEQERRARHRAALARRGPARPHRPAAPLHAGGHRAAPGRARPSRARTARPPPTAGERRPAARRARAAVPEAGDRQPHAPRHDRARRRPSSSPTPSTPACTAMLTIGIDGSSCRAALAAAEDFPQVLRGRRPPPQRRRGLRRRRPRRAARARRPPRAARRSARPASTTTATRAPRRTRSAPSPPRSSSRARPASRWSSTRAPPRTTRSRLLARARRRPPRDPALLLDARPAGRVPGPRLVDLVRRQRHLPEGARRCARPPRASPPTACWSRPTRPTSTPQAVRRQAQPARLRRRTPRASSPSAAASPTRARGDVERNAAALFGW